MVEILTTLLLINCGIFIFSKILLPKHPMLYFAACGLWGAISSQIPLLWD